MSEKTEQTIITCQKGDRIILPFPSDTPMTREGTDLIVHGQYEKRTLRLAGFYKVARTVKLIMDGEEIDPVEFFISMNAADLLPAADEGHGEESPQLTARGHIWDTMLPMTGLDHLNGLDISFPGDGKETSISLINSSSATDATDPHNSSIPEESGVMTPPEQPNTPDPGDNPNPEDTPGTPEKPDNPDTPGIPDKPDTPENPDIPDKPNNPDNPGGDTPPDEPDPIIPDPPEPPAPWPEGVPPPVWIRIVDEGNYAIKIKTLLESAMADEEKNIPYSGDSISTQADGDRPTYETTNPNLPSRMGVSFELAEGYHIIEVVEQGLHGHVEQEGDDWYYYLDEAIKHEPGQGTNLAEQGDTVVLLVGDAYGNEWEIETPVKIRDDVPEMSLGSKQDFNLIAGHEEHASGIVFNFGADDAAGKKLEITVGEGAKTVEITDTGETFTVNGELGVLTINPDGTYSYKANAYAPGKEGGVDKFTFKITDADGDTVTVDINGKSTLQFTVEMPPAPELSSRIDEREGVTENKPAAIEIPEGFHIISGGNGEHGTISQIAGTWVYILNEALDHGGQDDGKNVLEPGDTVTVRVGDEYGNEWEVEVPVAVVDDIPSITMAEDISVTAGETASSTGAFTFDFGADNGSGKILTVQVDGKEDVDFTDISQPMTVTGKYGTLTINPDGTYSYKADGVAYDSELPKDEFTFVIKDADGDIASVDDDGKPYKLTITTERAEAPELSAEIGEHEAIINGETSAVVIPEGYHIISGGTGEHGSISQVEGKWVYTLDEALDHGGQDDGKNKLEPGDTVTLVVGDDKGNTWEVQVPVAVIDDIPVAEAKAGEIDEGATDAISGTVIGEHTAGADGLEKVQWGTADVTADVTAGTEIKGQYGTLTANPDGTWSYAVDNDNAAVIELKEGETIEDVFDFKVFDTDGDTSSQQLTITINGVDNGVEITPDNPDPELPGNPDVPVDPDDPTTQGASELVFDKDLLGEDATLLTKSGTMAIDAPDGVKSLAFGELEIPLDGTEKTIDVAEGTLTVSYTETDAKTGTLNYSFTLKTPGDHKAEGETETIIRDFAFTVTDTDGSTGVSTIRVKIGDDEPKAENDSATIAEGDTTVLASEKSVVENDYKGADGDTIGTDATPVVWTAQNQYGTFTGKADGTWEYALDNTNSAVIRLKEGETLEETITYKIKDADGDESEATLTITITGKDNGVTVTPKDPDPEIPGDPDVPADPEDPTTQGAKLVFKDHDLLGDDASLLTKSGTMDVKAPDGVAKIMVGTTELALDGTEATIELPEGILTLSYTANGEQAGTINYTFAFDTPGDHPKEDPVGDELLTNDLRVVVTDTDGSEAKSTLHIDIEDDVPHIEMAEDLTVDSGNSVSSTGKINFDFGADNGEGKKLFVTVDGEEKEITPGADNVIEGAHGTLTVKADGSYSYDAKPITYDQATSGDGELSVNPGETVSNVTFNGWDTSGITNPDLLTDVQTIEIRSKSSVVDLGGDRYLMLSGYQTDLTPDLHFSFDPETGWTLFSYIKENAYGEDDYGDPFNWVAGANGNGYPTITQDAGGFSLYDYDGYNRLQIVGKIVDGSGQPAELASPVEGSVGFLNFGLYGVNASDASQDFDIYINGEKSDVAHQILGSSDKNYWNGNQLTVEIDLGDGNKLSGTWTSEGNGEDNFLYSATAEFSSGSDIEDTFTFKIVDADGDVATADVDGNPYDLTVTITRPEAPEMSAEIGEHEAIIEGKPSAVVIPEGYHIISGGEGEHGSISEIEGSWVYTLDEALYHGDADDGKNKLENADSVVIVVGDDKGNTWQVSVPVAVIDDVPVAEAQTGEIDEGAADPITGTVVGELTGGADGVSAVDWGKDGETADVRNDTQIEGLYGTITVQRDGSWSYVLDNSNENVIRLKEGETLEDVFDFKVIDADNDTSSEKLTITINGVDNGVEITPTDPDPEIPGDPDVPADPEDPTTQGAKLTFKDHDLLGDDQTALTKSGTMDVSAPDGVAKIMVGDTELALDGTESTIALPEGTLTLSYTADGEKAGVINYSFTFDTPGDHPKSDPVKDELLTNDLRIVVTDTDGSEAKSTLHIDIEDDVPTLTLGEDLAVLTGRDVTATGKMDFDWGADNGEGKKLTVTIDGKETPVEFTELGEPLVIEGALGTLTIQADGSYAYVAKPAKADENGGTEKFTFSIMDADGDVVDANDAGEPYTLTVTVTKPDTPSVVLPEVDEALDRIGALQVREGNLAEGCEIILPEGYSIQKVTAQGKLGTIEQVDGKWIYKLNEAQDSGDVQGENILAGADTFRIAVVRAADGKVTRLKMTVDVIDDVPEIDPEGAILDAGETATGTFNLDFGADDGEGKSLTVIFDGAEHEITGETAITGAHGTLTVQADGTYSYVANADGKGTDTFTVRVKDADGDTVEKPLEIAVSSVEIPEMAIDTTVARVPMMAPAGYRIAGVAQAPDHGTITQDANGDWYFEAGEALAGVSQVSFSLRYESEDGGVIVQFFTLPVIAVEVPGWEKESENYEITETSGYPFLNVLAKNYDGFTFQEIVSQGKYGHVLENGDFIHNAGDYVLDNNKPIVGGEVDGSGGSVTDEIVLRYVSDETGKTYDRTVSIKIVDNSPYLGEIGCHESKHVAGESSPVQIPDGYTILEVVTAGSKGDLTKDGDTWSYRLHTDVVADEGNMYGLAESADLITVKVRGPEGNEFNTKIQVHVMDDVENATYGNDSFEFGSEESGNTGIGSGGGDAKFEGGSDTGGNDSDNTGSDSGNTGSIGNGGEDVIMGGGWGISLPMASSDGDDEGIATYSAEPEAAPMSLLDSMIHESDTMSLTSLLDPDADVQNSVGYGMPGETVSGQLSIAVRDTDILSVKTDEGYVDIRDTAELETQTGTLTINPDGSWTYSSNTAGTETIKLKVTDADGQERDFDFTLESVPAATAYTNDDYGQEAAYADIPAFDDTGSGVVADAFDDITALTMQHQAENQG